MTFAMAMRKTAAAPNRAIVWLAVAAIGTIPFYWLGYESLVAAWSRPEYSYGPIVPFITAYMALREYKHRPIQISDGSRWFGICVVLFAVVLGILGNVTEIADFVTYSLIFAIGGLVLTIAGTREGLRFWPGWLHLFFMLPLPTIVYWQASTALQFLSSQIGVGVIKAVGIPVLLDGNVIDLGTYQLLVAEACSGLRYLFPLLSFGWLFAVLYTGPRWHRVILFFSTVPITVLMNSFRIAMIGVLVKYYGIGQAEGFLHVFEGWIIFITCIIALYFEAWVIWRFFSGRNRQPNILDIDYHGVVEPLTQLSRVTANRALMLSTALLVVLGIAWQLVPSTNTTIVDRLRFEAFPLKVMEMTGQQEFLDGPTEKVLAADDYFVATYQGQNSEVNLLLTYYERQLGGSGIHSPEVCLPSGGWEVSKWTGRDINVNGTVIHVNRAIIQKGLSRQLVYYWFEQRGRKITNDYQAKLLSMWDKMLTGRSDGGLVRLVAPISGDNIQAADMQLEAFMATLVPMLPDYYPLLEPPAKAQAAAAAASDPLVGGPAKL